MKHINYPDLDIAKLLMALLVVEIHTQPFCEYPQIAGFVDGIARVAVPFFFVASAFLCFRGLEMSSFSDRSSQGSVRVRWTIFKLLRLYLVWTVLFLPITVFGSILNGDSLPKAVMEFVRGTVFIGENYFSWPLWYLLAGVIGFLLVYICLRGGLRFRCILSISLALLFAGFGIGFLQQASDLPAVIAHPVKAYAFVFGSARNGLFEGFFYVATGAALGMMCEKLCSVPLWVELAAVAFGLLGNVFINNDAHLPFCAAFGIGLFLLSVRRHGPELKAHPWTRNTSTVVYLVHMFFVVLFVYGVCGGTNPSMYQNDVDWGMLYLFSLGGSLIVAAVVVPLSRRVPIIKIVFGI